MANYTSKVVSIRIDAELLDAVKRRARKDGRSISGELVHLVRAQIEVDPTSKALKPISGWLAGLEVPLDHAEFRRGRAEASSKLMASVRRRHSP